MTKVFGAEHAVEATTFDETFRTFPNDVSGLIDLFVDRGMLVEVS